METRSLRHMHGHTAAHTQAPISVCSPLGRIVSREVEDFFFFRWSLRGGEREDYVWCRMRWSTLSGVAALDALGLGMLWHRNGSRLRVQARLSRIYIYIKAATPRAALQLRREEHAELLCSRLHHQAVVCFLLCCCLHWNASSEISCSALIKTPKVRFLCYLKCGILNLWARDQKFGIRSVLVLVFVVWAVLTNHVSVGFSCI